MIGLRLLNELPVIARAAGPRARVIVNHRFSDDARRAAANGIRTLVRRKYYPHCMRWISLMQDACQVCSVVMEALIGRPCKA